MRTYRTNIHTCDSRCSQVALNKGLYRRDFANTKTGKLLRDHQREIHTCTFDYHR